MQNNFDIKQVYQFWEVFKNGNQLTEIRLIASDGRTGSGYFSDPQTMIEAVKPYVNDYSVYFTINSLLPDCSGKAQRDKIIMKARNSTTDSEIATREFVLVDLDSKRVSGVNATDEQLNWAKKKANEVYKFLRDSGFYDSIVVCSGSGVHLYLKCALLNNEENTKLVKRFLQALSMLFSDEHVDVDVSVHNASRIARAQGFYNRKGNNIDKERPQRLCEFVRVPDEIKVNEREYFEKIANLYPEDVRPTRENNYSTEKFDLDAFIENHGIKITKIENVSGGKKYILDHCPFNESHRGKDAVLFQRDTGEIAFHCFHSSCQQYSWRDVRLMFEPDAYSKKDYREFQYKQRYYGTMPPQAFEPVAETDDKGKKWLTSKDIKRKREQDIIAIPTGYPYLDKAIKGLILGEVTILSGLNGSGKSSWLNSVMLNVVHRGFKVACFSGELTDFNVMKWLTQSAAGKHYVKKVAGCDYAYEIDDMVYDKISDWLYEKFYLFNNNYGNQFQQVLSDLEEVVAKGVKLIVLDNLMALQISGLAGDKNEKQKQFILDIVEFAKRHSVHIVVVCHPRKESGAQTFLRKESIAGSGDLTNAVQNVAIVHRVGDDFCKRASEFFGKEKVEKYMEYSNVVEWCKNRSYGIVDYLVGMYYEVETKRFKNSIAEHIVYGWEEAPTQVAMPMENEFAVNDFESSPFSDDDGDMPW